jgi:hypothetical protein
MTERSATSTPTSSAPATSASFAHFYGDVFLPEHQHPVNRALHIAGTLAGLAYAAWVFTLPAWPWWLALVFFPVVHAGPGLIGHRLFERNTAVGDARWRRTDFPRWWFIVGNHRMTFAWLVGLPRRLLRQLRRGSHR